MEESENDVDLICLNEKSEKFVFDNEDSFDTDDIEEFVKNFKENKLKPRFKSESEPKDNSKRLIKVLVGSTFYSFLEQSSKKQNDILIYIYKSNCDECNQFEKLYTKLAQKYTNRKNLAFTKLNKIHNEYPDEFQTEKCPALYYVQWNNQKKPLLFDYSELSTLEDFIKFTEDNNSVKSSEKQEL